MDDRDNGILQASEKPRTRRAFYIGLISGAMSLIGLALAAPATIYLLFPVRTRKTPEWVNTGLLAGISTDKPTEIAFERKRVDGWKITTEKATAWVVKNHDNGVVAFSPVCTHLGCAYHWDDSSRTFLCPCHTSTFSVDGKVLSGPAPRPLDQYMTKITAGKLQLGPLITSQGLS